MNLDRSYRDIFSRRRRRRILAAATILAAVLLAVDISSGGALRAPLRATVARIGGGASLFSARVSASGYLASKRSLASENARLRTEIARMTERDSSRTALERENEMLRELAQVVERGSGLSAPVRSSLGASPYGTFLIGAGSAEGVSVGQGVISEGGFVIGTIAEVHEHTAVVGMLFAPGNTTEALIADTPAAVEGRGGGNARAQLPRGIEIRVGAPVTSHTFGGRPIGIVGKVDSDAARSEQTAYIALPVDPASLRFVRVVPL